MFNYNNEYVYGSDIADLRRDSSITTFMPMYLKPAATRDMLVGWDPVWAWECVIARQKALQAITSNPSAEREWTNEVEYNNLDNLRSGIYSIEADGAYHNHGRFITDTALITTDKVLTSYSSSSWESAYPGLDLTHARDTYGTHAVMDDLTLYGPLKKAFWYDGVWRRLSQMKYFLNGFYDLIPGVLSGGSYTCTTIRSEPESGFSMFWPIDSYGSYRCVVYFHGASYNSGLFYPYTSGKNEGKAAMTDLNVYISTRPTPQPSRALANKEFNYDGNGYVVFEVSWLVGGNSDVKYVICDAGSGAVSDYSSTAFVNRLKSLCGVPRDPSVNTLETPGEEHLLIRIVDYKSLCHMVRTDVVFAY